MERGDRIGWLVSGIMHAAVILWAILGGVLFRPQPGPAVRTTEVATMSGAEFEAYAAAARGQGPVAPAATSVTAMTPQADLDSPASSPAETSPPVTQTAAESLPTPADAGDQPDLSDLARPEPVEVATELNSPLQQPEAEPAPTAPAQMLPPVASTVPDLPTEPAVAEPENAPRSELALDSSPRPLSRPSGLVEAYEARIAEALAAQQEAAAEAERLAAEQAEAEARRAAAQAEAERQAAQRAEAERLAAEQRAEEQRQAERRAAEAQAEAKRRAAEERAAAAARAEAAREEAERAEAARIAAEEAAEAERQAAAERAAAEEAAAEAEARRRAEALEAERREAARLESERLAAEAADRQALEDALREAQDGTAGAEGTDTASGEDDPFSGIYQIEGGDGASAAQDPLAAALAEAMSRGEAPPSPDGAVGDGIGQMPLAPMPIRPTDLSQTRGQRAPTGGFTPGDGAPIPMGAPLSLAEREAFRTALQACWNTGYLSQEASRMEVSVAFRLTPDGRPDPNSLRLAGFTGGSDTGARQVFDVARRAILRCGRAGFPLPADKYGRWQNVVVDFRPDGIRIE